MRRRIWISSVVALWFTGCGLTHGGNGSAVPPTAAQTGCAAVGAPDVAGFRDTLYAAVMKAPIQCSNCHSSTATRTQTPYFADPDITRAYEAARPLAESSLISHTHDGHCGSVECASGNVAGTSAMTAALRAWANAAPSAPCPVVAADTSLTLEPRALPANLPVHVNGQNDTYATLTWPIAGGTISIDIQMWAVAAPPNPGAYRFTNPRVKLASGAARVREIHILVNGVESAPATTFLSIDTTVTAESGAPLLSAQNSVPILQIGTDDKIALRLGSFDVLTAPPACKHPELFPSVASCTSCHGSSGGAGYSAFQMAGPDLCVRALTRTIRGSADTVAYSSPLLRKPLNGANGHTVVTFDPTAWVNWINSER